MTKQLNESENDDATDLEPINLGLPILRELGAKWLVEVSEYFEENPQIMVNGFMRAGITGALDKVGVDEEWSEKGTDSDDEFDDDEDEMM